MNLSFYSFFSKYSLLTNYGFTAGLVSKTFRKFVPETPSEDSFEFFIKLSRSKYKSLAQIHPTLEKFLADTKQRQVIAEELDLAIRDLSAKVISFGLDRRFQAIFKTLDIDASSFQKLMLKVGTARAVWQTTEPSFEEILDEVHATISCLRTQKDKIGTSLHLTILTKRILDYTVRIKRLVVLREDITAVKQWDELIQEYIAYDKTRNSLRKYLGAHVDLLALQIVERTAQKGEKYVAENVKEYRGFFKKGLIGGAVIAFFAIFKTLIDANVSAGFSRALLYSLNYASCFILVKFLGGTIATKQPAMTASAIIKDIDTKNELTLGPRQDIILLLRKVSRSQFISLVGNFVMAFSMACLLGYVLSLGWVSNPVDEKKAAYFIKQTSLFSGGAFYYAAIAGVFLSLSGFISGYFDNKVIASQLPYRIQHYSILSRFLPQKTLGAIARFIEKDFGGVVGNLSLGFFLGSAWLLKYILPFNVDIRHIAFSSSNVGYAIVNDAFSSSIITTALLSVLTIGLVNFVVSFSITFIVALKSRGITASGLRKLFFSSVRDIFTNPLDYFIIRRKEPRLAA